MTTPTGDSTPPEPGPVALVARLLTVQLLAVIGVAAVIAVVFALAGWGTGDSVTAVPGATTSSATDSAGTDPAPETSASTPVTTPPATSPPATAPAASTPAASTPSSDLPKVDVLNQSAPGGSASTVAARVRSRGWVVGRVDDFHGNVSTTTVYYPPGLHSEAKDLADDLSGSPRVQEAFNTISDTRLTVILVD
jgi:LytR cell envelope-related transcriptional attenuator